MTDKTYITILTIFLAVCLLLLTASLWASPQCDRSTERVKRIADGDTFQTVEGDWIRLARIDTPEQGQAGYKEAKQWLARYEGEQVKLDCSGRGYYDRRICEVFHNDTNLNNKLLNLGLAEKYE